ncbi:MAG: threonine ammonia-lyase [Alphaproteobacteria bacterium]|nr:threonine ammonia-lyase [Alphaproteobacteria bacterium]
MTVTIEDIHTARQALEGQVVRTPMLYSPKLSDITGAEIWVKYENMQVTNSFKDRGAYIRLSKLDAEQKQKGVIAMSAGNHAQAVAYHAKRLGIPATIVMPQFTPFTKVERTKAHGAEVVLSGETLDDARATVEEIITARGLTLVHPYDDDDVIAGQGTIALEMLEEVPDLDVLVIPIGGGGILAGNAISSRSLNPEIELIGVEAELYPSMYNLVRGKEMKCGGITLADGIAVKSAGLKTSAIIEKMANDIRLVSEAQIERAVNAYFGHQKTSAEGAGASPLAAVMADPEHFAGRKVGLILCGGNIDPRIMASVIYRELERELRIVNIRVTIDDRPGVLAAISTIIGETGANILEVAHSRMFLEVSAKGAELDFMIETRGPDHVDEVVEALEAADFNVRVLDSPGGKATPNTKRPPS